MNRKPLTALLPALLLGGSMVACSPDDGAPAGKGADPAAASEQAPAQEGTVDQGDVDEGDVDDYGVQIEQWRSERIARLQRPDGWLSLVGLHWLDPGSHSIGSGEGNDIVLAVGPEHLGQIALEDGTVRFTAADDAAVRVDDGVPVGPVVLAPDSSGKPTQVALEDGRAGFVVIERSGRLGLRVKDADAKTLTEFTGIESFPVDPAWRIDARFEAHPPGKTIPIASVINTLEPMPNPGAVVFERDGKTHRLQAVDEGDGQLFLIFADRTSGSSTYGAGRFLYADPPAPGSDRVVVDFNRAYNPPCALNAYSTCPLPPPENRLDLEVAAGEKTYLGSTH